MIYTPNISSDERVLPKGADAFLSVLTCPLFTVDVTRPRRDHFRSLIAWLPGVQLVSFGVRWPGLVWDITTTMFSWGGSLIPILFCFLVQILETVIEPTLTDECEA